jgi:hypothetical protein
MNLNLDLEMSVMQIVNPENTSIARQWCSKHTSTVTINHTTTGIAGSSVFCIIHAMLHKEKQQAFLVNQECELITVRSGRLFAAECFWLAGVSA